MDREVSELAGLLTLVGLSPRRFPVWGYIFVWCRNTKPSYLPRSDY